MTKQMIINVQPVDHDSMSINEQTKWARGYMTRESQVYNHPEGLKLDLMTTLNLIKLLVMCSEALVCRDDLDIEKHQDDIDTVGANMIQLVVRNFECESDD